MRMISCIAAVLLTGVVAPAALAQTAPITGPVFLRPLFSEQPHSLTCPERNGFVRIGPFGDITQPEDQNGVFDIPRGNSLSVTDIHLFDHNDTDTPFTASVNLYLEGIQGEIILWSASVVVPPHGDASYDRALTTGIVIAGPWEFCNVVSGIDADHPPQLVVTGTLR